MLQVITFEDAERLVDSAVRKVVAEYKPSPFVMTKRQLAEYVQKPISTINRWMKEGLPYRKEGNEYPEFYLPQVNRWLEERFNERVQNLSGKADHSEG